MKKHNYIEKRRNLLKLKFSVRILVVVLSLTTFLGVLPINIFSMDEVKEVVTGVSVDKTEYYVKMGTGVSEIGLPKELAVTISLEGKEEGKEPVKVEKKLEVLWEGTYDENVAGVYPFTSKFGNDVTLADSVTMPVVNVKVEELNGSARRDTQVEEKPLTQEAQDFINGVNQLNKEKVLTDVSSFLADKSNEGLKASILEAMAKVKVADEKYKSLLKEEQLSTKVVEAYTSLSELYQAIVPIVNEVTGVVKDEEYNFQINGSDSLFRPNDVVNFLEGINLDIKKKDGTQATESELKNYELRIKSVISSDGSYIWKEGETSTIGGGTLNLKYVINFGVWNVKENNWVANVEKSYKKLGRSLRSTILDMLDKDDQYINTATVKEYVTGTAPFDADDMPGNDLGSANDTIRTFDTIGYTLSLGSQGYSSSYYYKKGYVGFKMVLPLSEKEAEFDTDSMGWLVSGTKTKYDYKLTKEAIDGKQCQVLTGYRYLDAEKAGVANTFPISTLEVNVAIKVKAMKNGDEVKPDIYTWCDNNDVKFYNTDYVCQKEGKHGKAPNGGKELVKIVINPIKVTAAPRYNVLLQKCSTDYVDGVDKFDFSTGNSLALNKDKGSVYGRISAYGLTLQLHNNATNKGLRGIEVPNGNPITFDVTFKEQFKPTSSDAIPMDLKGTDSKYTPLVWSYEGHSNADEQADERAVVRYGYNYLPGLSVFNNEGGNITTKLNPIQGSNKVADGGKWTVSQNGDKLSFTVSGYKINTDYFPNSVPGRVPNREDVYFKLKDGIESTYVGCFSGAEVYVVVPFGGDGDVNHSDYLASKYGKGTIQLTVEDANLKATSISGQVLDTVANNGNQMVTNDDVQVSTYYLSKPGSYENRVQYSSQTGTDLSDIHNKLENYENGKDTASIGQSITIKWGGFIRTNGELRNGLKGMNSLMKFDDKAVEISGNPNLMGFNKPDPNGKATFIYGAKKDGTGWANFKEMHDAKEEDLIYFESLEALKTQGYTCVGVLMEYRSDTGQITNTYALGRLPITIKNDYSLAGYVAPVMERTTLWSGVDFVESGNEIPKRLDVQAGEAYMPGKSMVKDFTSGEYIKATYDEDGNYIGGHTGTSNLGDSVYIVPYKAGISKFVLQKNEDGSVKNIFNLDDGQNQVDFKLDMTLKQSIETTEKKTTKVTIVDTLPKGSMYNNDAVLGGTFTLDNPKGKGYKGNVIGGTKVGEKDKDGIEFEVATIGVDKEGRTTITFEFNNVPIGTKNLPSIYYSIKIDAAAAKNGQQYKNVATIRTLEDNREKSMTNGNVTDAGFSVAKNSSMSLSKLVKNKYVEIGGNIEFTLTWQNTGKNNVSGSPMMDTMPSNNDENGSKFSGTHKLEDIIITNNNGSTTDFTGLEVWYTTDPSVKGKYSENFTDEKIRSEWKSTKISSTGKVEGISGEHVIAWGVLGTVKSGQMIQATCIVKPDGGKSGDKFINAISLKGSVGIAEASIVSRKLSGVTWLDSNKDGQRQYDEKRISGITAKLVTKVDYEANGGEAKGITNLSGSLCEMQTDALGNYEFADLPAGEFVVVFLDGSTVLGEYKMTKTKAPGVSNKVDSDSVEVVEDGLLKSGYIKDIKMPETKDIKSSPYVIGNLDAGLYQVGTEFEITKTDNEGKVLPEAEFKLYNLRCSELHVHEDNCYTAIKEGAEDKIWISDTSGYINFGELYNGVYKLVEIKAPKGYETPRGYWKIIVDNKKKDKAIEIVSVGKAPSFTENGGKYSLANNKEELITVEGKKIWEDQNNQDGKRPSSIIVNLLLNGKVIDTKTVTEDDGWNWKFTELKKYENGIENIYTVKEEKVEGYQTKVSGYDIINTYTPGKISINVVKSWKDENNREKVRPNEVIIKLFADGGDTGKQIFLSKTNNWTDSFVNLDEYKNGVEIEYTITEVEVSGYKVEITGDKVNGFTVVNTHIPINEKLDNNIPRTGDDTHPALWTIVMMGSLLDILVLVVLRKKYKIK